MVFSCKSCRLSWSYTQSPLSISSSHLMCQLQVLVSPQSQLICFHNHRLCNCSCLEEHPVKDKEIKWTLIMQWGFNNNFVSGNRNRTLWNKKCSSYIMGQGGKKGGNVLACIFTQKLKKVIFFKNISICCKIMF